MDDGGAQKIVLNYANDFKDDKQIKMNILSLSSKCSTLYDEKIKKENVKIDYLKAKRWNFKNHYINLLFEYYQLNKQIKKYISANKPDIVHLHLFGTLLFAHNAIKKCKVPLRFYTLHSAPSRFTGGKLKLLQKSFKDEKYIPICVTNEQAKFAREYYKFDKFEVVHNGIDFENIKKQIIDKKSARHKFSFSINDYIICGVGRLDKIKRFDKLIRIFSKVYENNKNAKLVIAGDGKELLHLKELAQKLQLEDRVIFLGNINNIVELYCAADTLAVTSETESASLVLLEAQICNLDCVISSGVPKESIITENVIQMKENADNDKWAKTLAKCENRENSKCNFLEYDVHQMSKKMKDIYIKYWREYNFEK